MDVGNIALKTIDTNQQMSKTLVSHISKVQQILILLSQGQGTLTEMGFDNEFATDYILTNQGNV